MRFPWHTSKINLYIDRTLEIIIVKVNDLQYAILLHSGSRLLLGGGLLLLGIAHSLENPRSCQRMQITMELIAQATDSTHKG
jgi:hypothetical protein